MTSTIIADTGTGDRDALRLAAWLSPSFPVGAFAYSGGLEWAVEDGLVVDRASLQDWLAPVLERGVGRQDAVLLARAWRANGDEAALLETAFLAAALKGTPELAQETMVQGTAFLRTVQAAWPDPALDRAAALLREAGVEPGLPVAVGLAASAHGIGLPTTLTLFLHAVVANAVSAALRLSVIGQTDGQRIIAALEPLVQNVAADAETAGPDDLGTATAMVDWCSMRHETQHTRLFRS